MCYKKAPLHITLHESMLSPLSCCCRQSSLSNAPPLGLPQIVLGLAVSVSGGGGGDSAGDVDRLQLTLDLMQ